MFLDIALVVSVGRSVGNVVSVCNGPVGVMETMDGVAIAVVVLAASPTAALSAERRDCISPYTQDASRPPRSSV